MEEGLYDDESASVDLEDNQKVSLAKWFLLNAPSEEIHYVAKDVRKILTNDRIFDAAAAEALPVYNLDQMITLEMSNGSGQVLVTQFGEVDGGHYLDPRTAQVATVDHVNQVCTGVRPAADEELPSAYVEEYRSALDAEVLKYVEEAYPGGGCSVYCTRGKDCETEGGEFQFTVVISTSSFSPKNFRGGRWRSVWKVEIQEELQAVDMQGQINVNAHYFEEGNVQLNTSYECQDSTMVQGPMETAVSVVNAIRHQESEYLSSLEVHLSDNLFGSIHMFASNPSSVTAASLGVKGLSPLPTMTKSQSAYVAVQKSALTASSVFIIV